MPDVPESSGLRSDEDNTLVARSKLYNEAFAAKDLDRLNALFDAKVVYHADEVSRAASAYIRKSFSFGWLIFKWTVCIEHLNLKARASGRHGVLRSMQSRIVAGLYVHRD